MPLLSQEEILKLRDAVISARMASSRRALLTGIDAGFTASLPQAAVPGDQILTDLDAMNAAEALADGSVPLAVWLKTAIASAGPKKEARVFRDALRRIEAHDTNPSGAAQPTSTGPLPARQPGGAPSPSDGTSKKQPGPSPVGDGSSFTINISNSTVGAFAVGESSSATGTVRLPRFGVAPAAPPAQISQMTPRAAPKETVQATWEIVLDADLAALDPTKLAMIVDRVRKLTADESIRLVATRPGSVVLTLIGSREAYAVLAALYRDGQFKEVAGIPVLNVRWQEDSRPAEVPGAAFGSATIATASSDNAASTQPPTLAPEKSVAAGNPVAPVAQEPPVASVPNLVAPGPATSAPTTARAKISVQALIMKGGGVKGLALAGAIVELEKYYTFSTFVGTSAGAIAAVLSAAGYTGQELVQELRALNFRDFLDSSQGRGFLNLLFEGGLNTGAPIVDWIATKLQKRVSYIESLPLNKLPHRAIVYAALKGRGELEFASQGANSSLDTAFAARCSMSIPGFFAPKEHEGRRVYDGGLLNNFPVEVYLRRGGSPDFIALYLGSDKVPSRRRGWQIMDVLDILLNRNEPAMVDQYRDQTVIIDTAPIGMVDFDLSDREKEFLVLQGRAAALKFLLKRSLPNGPDPVLAMSVAQEAAELKAVIQAARRRRSARRIFLVVALLLAALGAVLVKAGVLPFGSRVSLPAANKGATPSGPSELSTGSAVEENLVPDGAQVRGVLGPVCVQSNSGQFAYCSDGTIEDCQARMNASPPGPFRANHKCVLRPAEVWCFRYKSADGGVRDVCAASSSQCDSARSGYQRVPGIAAVGKVCQRFSL